MARGPTVRMVTLVYHGGIVIFQTMLVTY